MKPWRLIFTLGCVCLLLPALAALEVTLALAQGSESELLQDPSSTFQTTLAELGFEERVLHSPYGDTGYTLRLPQDWQLDAGSSFELDFSYTYERVGISDTQPSPPLFGDLVVAVDGQTQLVFPIAESTIENARLSVPLPVSLLNDPDRSLHNIRVTLEGSPVCSIFHRARLIIHSTSVFSLLYTQLPIVPDLSLYPYPLYRRAFEPDQALFVLPAQPAEMELTGAMAVAARLGRLASRMVISGTTDLELLSRLETGGSVAENLIVIGKPETNDTILILNQLGVLPVSLRERQLDIGTEGPTVVAPGDILTYTLTITNTTPDAVSSLSLIDTLPAYTDLVTCSPECVEAEQGREVNWSIPSLQAGAALSCRLELRVSQVITDATLENTATLLDALSVPLNVSTLTTTATFAPLPASGVRTDVSSKSRYFFSYGERAVPENDGIVQELVSPWNQVRAILVITGLSDEAIYKASQAMSFESRFPGMKGQFALVREVRPLPDLLPEDRTTDLTFADLGYGDTVLQGRSQEANYYFYVPFNWRLAETAYLELRFGHSSLLGPVSSSLNVLFNDQKIATIALNDETALSGKLRVGLPLSQVRLGRRNTVSIQTEMHALDECVSADIWLLIREDSLFHLDHEKREVHSLFLDVYPYPFDQRSDLADVLFVLPTDARSEEWAEILQLAATLGSAAGGPNLLPSVALGDTWSETELSDYHLIVMGRHSRNPLLQQANAQLPQPFLPGSDEIDQRIDDVILRLPPDLSLGLVQLIPSPWNRARAFLAVTGTTDEGVKWAVDALTERPWDLKGDVTLIGGDEIANLDTHGLTSSGTVMAISEAISETTSVVVSATTAVPEFTLAPSDSASERPPAETHRPGWLIPFVGAMGLAVFAIFAFAFWQMRQRRL